MKYGMPTLIEDDSIEESAKRCKTLGLDFVEINMNLPRYQANLIDVAKFKSIAAEQRITYTIHVDENLNPFDFNDRVAMAYLDTMLDTIKLAKELAAPIINMHLSQGVYFTMPSGRIFLFEKYRDIYLKKVKEFREIVEIELAQDDIKICVENCGTFEDFQLAAIEILLASPSFFLTFDIGHAACNQDFMNKYYTSHVGKLAHMHCHDALQDNKGVWKDHLAIGTGSLDIEYYHQFAKNLNLSMVLETKIARGLTQSAEWLRTRKYII